MDGLTADTGSKDVAIVDIGDTGEDMGQTVKEVKIPFPMSHNEGYVLKKSEIAPLALSGSHLVM